MEHQIDLVETPKRKGWPKGKPRKPRIVEMSEETPPVAVRVRLRGMEPFEFGCSQHFVENGFHVFIYPSGYRETRREIAVSEVIDIELTSAYSFTRVPAPVPPARILPVPEIQSLGSGRPIIHSAREDALKRLAMAAEQPVGSVKIDAVPGITLGGSEG